MEFQTRRIILRAPVAEDDEPLVALFTDPETMRHLPVLHNKPWDAPRMAERREARAHEEILGRARNFSVLLRNGEEALSLIGQAGYRTIWGDETPKRGELGVMLAHAQHGRGLVWDVHLVLLALGFEALGLEIVEWATGVENEAMRAVLRKMGCKDEGVFEESGYLWVKYTLHTKDWVECRRWLCEKVDRLAGSSASQAVRDCEPPSV